MMTEMAVALALSVKVLVQLLSKMMVFSANPSVSSALSQCHEHTRVCRWPAHKSGISATVSHTHTLRVIYGVVFVQLLVRARIKNLNHHTASAVYGVNSAGWPNHASMIA
jgi:hypothetical protein